MVLAHAGSYLGTIPIDVAMGSHPAIRRRADHPRRFSAGGNDYHGVLASLVEAKHPAVWRVAHENAKASL
jgi:hypothetical protein